MTFNIQESLAYPTDFLRINFYNAFINNADAEVICYFTDPNDLTVQKVKSHRCTFAAGILEVYIPEEITPIASGKDWKLTITKRFSGGF